MSQTGRTDILKTYVYLRVGVGAVALALPLILWQVGKHWAGISIEDANSMSGYYNEVGPTGRSMRDVFVGGLFFMGGVMLLYKGFSRLEDWLLNVAGVGSIVVALVPTAARGVPSPSRFTVHGFAAYTAFACMAVVCWVCSKSTLREMDPDKRKYWRGTYGFFSAVMLIAPAIAVVLKAIGTDYNAFTFRLEWMGLAAFGAYWIAKSVEISQTEADKKALRVELREDPREAGVDAEELAGAAR
jgi:hypothetical protein